MQTRATRTKSLGRLTATATAVMPASAPLETAITWTASAQAAGVTSACGPGVELRNCPPLCSKPLSASAVSKIFHVHLSDANWHVDGEPQDVCTYTESSDPNLTVSDTIDAHESVDDFNGQVQITKQFNRGATAQTIPALSNDAVDVVHCVGSSSSAWCYPNVIVFSKGYLIQIGEALATVNLATMDKMPARDSGLGEGSAGKSLSELPNWHRCQRGRPGS